MKKKTKSKLRAADFLVIFLCLLFFSGFIFLFYKDLTHFTRRSDKTQVATVQWRDRVVQRKFNDRVVWELLAPDAPLYDEDTVRTSELSKTGIRFGSGDECVELSIFENTLVQIFTTEEGELQINLSGGDIKVDSTAGASQFAIKMADGSTVKVMGGSSVSAGSNPELGRSTVDVANGQAELSAADGSQVSLGTGESVSVDEDGIQQRPLTVVSIPKDLNVITHNETANPVTLEWRTIPSAEGSKVTIQTSRTKDFSVIEEILVVDDINHISLDPGDKTLYWRVYTESGKDSPAEGKITVNRINPVAVSYPRNSADLEYRASPEPVRFKWDGNPLAEGYTLTVSKNQDLSEPLVNTRVTGESFQSEALPEGFYYWKVTPWYSGKIDTEGESPLASFSVEKDTSEDTPLLSVPATNAKFDHGSEIPITFIWHSEERNTQSLLSIARDKDFNDIVLEEKIDMQRLSTSFDGSSLPPGTYYWKVSREDSGKKLESEMRSFQIVTPQKEEMKLLYPPDDFGVESEKIADLNFMWKLPEQSEATSSTIQISSSKDFSSVVKEVRTDKLSEKGLDLKEGIWYWRVATTSDGKTEFSPARKIQILGKLSAPEVESSTSVQEILTNGSSPAKFSWEKVEDADYYILKVYDADGKKVLETKTDKTSISQGSFTNGTYTWQVQAVSAEKENYPVRMSGISKGSFSVRSPDPINLISPATGISIAGLTALRNDTTFTWKKSADAVSYQLVLSKLNSDGSTRVVEQKNTKGDSASISRLTSGTYTWKVKASTSDGVPISSEERRFVIERLPELPAPTLTSPQKGFLIGPDFLRENRSITFAWNKVSGATVYSFNLYKKTADGKNQAILTRRNLKQNKVELTDFSILDIGTFTWTVTAYSYASDGYEERRSQSSSSSFKIDFSLPEKVETITQGVIYVE
ncbi:MAG: hypothetical protein ILP07_02955 [Treponema sp.]|nr:hypothetical protein [Treponema sp.]